MDSKTPSNSALINNVRNLNINRRGGVRTRGGRLLPINMQGITQLTSSSRKAIAPNIPQRRTIKTEVETSGQLVVKTEKTDSPISSRGKGRQQRVYLQTEGSFLADGPAARMKRDPTYDDSFSIPRASRKSANSSSNKNIDIDVIKDLMKSYVAGEEYDNDTEGKAPFRLPLQKDAMIRKVKVEPEEDKAEIKKEVIENFETGIKEEIKTEKDKDFVSVKNEDCVSVKDRVIFKELETKKPLADNFLNVKDDGTLILLQMPILSDSLNAEALEDKKSAKKDEQSAKDNESKVESKFVDNLEEGFIGKLKIMKSGRMKLKLGSVEFELLDGTPSQTYQEAVSIQMQDKEGDVIVLGKVENKLILSPEINKLLIENVKNSKTLDFEE